MLWRKPKARDMAREHHERALGFLADGHQSEALAEFEASLSVNADYLPARLGLSRLHLDEGRADEALPHCQHVLKLDATHAEGGVLLARAYALHGKYDWAVGQLKRTLLIDPDHLEAMELLREVNGRRMALTPGEAGSYRHQQSWAISEYHQIRKTVARQSSLGWRLRRLFGKRS